MKVTCIHCHKSFDLSEAGMDARGRKIQNLLGSLGSAASLVSEYVDLFKTGSTMSDKKRFRITKEVFNLIRTGEFTLNRRQYRVSQRTVIEGITEVVNRNLAALTNHRYLFRVLAGKAETRADEERRVTEKRRPAPAPATPVQPEDEETRAVREEAMAAIRKIGEKMRIPGEETGGSSRGSGGR